MLVLANLLTVVQSSKRLAQVYFHFQSARGLLSHVLALMFCVSRLRKDWTPRSFGKESYLASLRFCNCKKKLKAKQGAVRQISMVLIHSYWGSSFPKQQTLQKVVWCYAMHCSELYGQKSLINSREKVNSRKCFPGHCRMFLDSGNCKTRLENWCSCISSDAGIEGAPLESWISGRDWIYISCSFPWTKIRLMNGKWLLPLQEALLEAHPVVKMLEPASNSCAKRASSVQRDQKNKDAIADGLCEAGPWLLHKMATQI